jgi:hypothetical protein
MILDNRTDEKVKACIYSTGDNIDFIPCEGGVVFLEPSMSVEWSFAQGVYVPNPEVRFFHPEFFDKLLARRVLHNKDVRVQLSKDGTGYKVDLLS